MSEPKIEWWVSIESDRGTLFAALRQLFGGHGKPEYEAWWERTRTGFHRFHDEEGEDEGAVTYTVSTMPELRQALAIADAAKTRRVSIGCTVESPTVRASAQIGEDQGPRAVHGAIRAVGAKSLQVTKHLNAIREAVGELDALTREAK